MARKRSKPKSISRTADALRLESRRRREQAQKAADPRNRALAEAERKAYRLEGELRSARATADSMKAELAHAEERIELLAGLSERQTSKPFHRQKRQRGPAGDATAVIVLSDWHVEESVEAAKVGGLNAFNLKIAAERIERTFQKSLMLLEDARHLADIREVVVAVLGDLISGYIHEELEEANALAPLPAARFAQEQLAAGLRLLLAEADVERIVVPTCYGNHGRTTKRMRFATGDANSFEQNLYYVMAQQFAGEPRIEWKIEPGLHNWVEVQGHQVRFHHGDSIKYQGGVGGITIPVNKAIAQWNRARKANLDVFGHWHQFCWNWSWVSNGCLIGYSPYALRIKADFQPPTQTFMVIDRDNGLTRALPIYCTQK